MREESSDDEGYVSSEGEAHHHECEDDPTKAPVHLEKSDLKLHQIGHAGSQQMNSS